MSPRTLLPRLLADPRHYQIAMLSVLLAFGVTRLGFDIRPWAPPLFVGGCLAVQWLGTLWLRRPRFDRARLPRFNWARLSRFNWARLSRFDWARLPRFDARSPLISALSLTLLLRTDSPALALAAAALAIGSKFLLRWRGKHLFNPTNLALVVLLLTCDAAWVSPSQWGSRAFLAFLVAGFGGLVVYRAERADVTLAFLASYALLVFGRAAYLGDPLTIPRHQLGSGALLVFAFFMISDPKTTPDARGARVAFGALVAALGFTIQFVFWEPNGLLYALALAAPLVPLADRLRPATRYDWPRAPLSLTLERSPS